MILSCPTSKIAMITLRPHRIWSCFDYSFDTPIQDGLELFLRLLITEDMQRDVRTSRYRLRRQIDAGNLVETSKQ